jgi:hypothetical protein
MIPMEGVYMSKLRQKHQDVSLIIVFVTNSNWAQKRLVTRVLGYAVWAMHFWCPSREAILQMHYPFASDVEAEVAIRPNKLDKSAGAACSRSAVGARGRYWERVQETSS